MKSYFITGGAGFVGSNLSIRLLSNPKNSVTVYDNFSNGNMDFFGKAGNSVNLKVISGDILDLDKLTSSMGQSGTVIHLAANADIAASSVNLDLDFQQSTLGTFNVLKAMKANQVREIIYSSGSGVYGNIGETFPEESYGPLKPVSMYGATKLSAESLISAFSCLYNIKATIFRFANIVGNNQTHGVGYDFLRKLKINSKYLEILGDGMQSKSYIHIDDVIDAIQLVESLNYPGTEIFNLSSGDYITVKEIAYLAIQALRLENVKIKVGETPYGWLGDVPVVRLNDTKLRSIGWSQKYNSKEAIAKSLAQMVTKLNCNT